MQKIKAASELYIETEKKKREKAYLGKYIAEQRGPGSRRVAAESHLVVPRTLRAGRWAWG